MLLRDDILNFFNFQVNQSDKVLFASLSKPIFVFGCNYRYKYKYAGYGMSLLFCTTFSGASLSTHSLIHGWTSSIWTVASTRLGHALQPLTSAQGSVVSMPCMAWESYWCATRFFSQWISVLFWFFLFPSPFHVCLDNFICRFWSQKTYFLLHFLGNVAEIIVQNFS